MGYSIGYDNSWERDIGYGVPAYCDHPNCMAEIDRGLSYVCGGDPCGGDRGCGLYFCEKHLSLHSNLPQLCDRCYPRRRKPFNPTPDHPDWIRHKLTDSSWREWRDKNPGIVFELSKTQHLFCKRCMCIEKICQCPPQRNYAVADQRHVDFLLWCDQHPNAPRAHVLAELGRRFPFTK